MSAPTAPGDRATVTVSVMADPSLAFELFTGEIDRWWRRGRRFRNAPGDRGFVRLEPGLGGRVFESFDVEGVERVIEIGRIVAWNPPRHVAFEWRNVNFAPSERTFVDVTFEPVSTGTRVTLVHRGWSGLRPGHPARHGLEGPAVSRMVGLWWGDQLTSLRMLVAATDAEDIIASAADPHS